MNEKVTIDARDAVLEGRLKVASASHAVAIAHPHPLYGGDMNNPVVSVIADAFAEKGWSALRFNFRGAGRSTGRHDNGVGEQEDIQAAVDLLKSRGYRHIDLAGYSFGAWVMANWSRNRVAHGHRLLLVAPPVAFVDFDLEKAIPGLKHVFTGQLDDIAPPGPIESAMPRWGADAKFSMIEGADHFYQGYLDTLQLAISQTIVRPEAAPTD